jgi:hypothetical protein
MSDPLGLQKMTKEISNLQVLLANEILLACSVEASRDFDSGNQTLDTLRKQFIYVQYNLISHLIQKQVYLCIINDTIMQILDEIGSQTGGVRLGNKHFINVRNLGKPLNKKNKSLNKSEKTRTKPRGRILNLFMILLLACVGFSSGNENAISTDADSTGQMMKSNEAYASRVLDNKHITQFVESHINGVVLSIKTPSTVQKQTPFPLSTISTKKELSIVDNLLGNVPIGVKWSEAVFAFNAIMVTLLTGELAKRCLDMVKQAEVLKILNHFASFVKTTETSLALINGPPPPPKTWSETYLWGSKKETPPVKMTNQEELSIKHAARLIFNDACTSFNLQLQYDTSTGVGHIYGNFIESGLLTLMIETFYANAQTALLAAKNSTDENKQVIIKEIESIMEKTNYLNHINSKIQTVVSLEYGRVFDKILLPEQVLTSGLQFLNATETDIRKLVESFGEMYPETNARRQVELRQLEEQAKQEGLNQELNRRKQEISAKADLDAVDSIGRTIGSKFNATKRGIKNTADAASEAINDSVGWTVDWALTTVTNPLKGIFKWAFSSWANRGISLLLIAIAALVGGSALVIWASPFLRVFNAGKWIVYKITYPLRWAYQRTIGATPLEIENARQEQQQQANPPAAVAVQQQQQANPASDVVAGRQTINELNVEMRRLIQEYKDIDANRPDEDFGTDAYHEYNDRKTQIANLITILKGKLANARQSRAGTRRFKRNKKYPTKNKKYGKLRNLTKQKNRGTRRK